MASKDNSALFFYGHGSGVRYPFLSNFSLHEFIAPDPAQWLKLPGARCRPVYTDYTAMMNFYNSEQYFMYCKAILFSNQEVAEKILKDETPSGCKALGRTVKNFDGERWDEMREIIMEEALWWKFGGGMKQFNQHVLPDIGNKLVETGCRELVEAAPNDRIWGIGFRENKAENNRSKWGLNLLGLALMRVRRRLQELN